MREVEEGTIAARYMVRGHTCQCMFYRQYFLPCKHLFLLDLVAEDQSYLTDEFWSIYVTDWEESGFEIYQTMETFIDPIIETEEEKAKRAESLRVLSKFEECKSLYYDVIKYVDGEAFHDDASKDLGEILDSWTTKWRNVCSGEKFPKMIFLSNNNSQEKVIPENEKRKARRARTESSRSSPNATWKRPRKV